MDALGCQNFPKAQQNRESARRALDAILRLYLPVLPKMRREPRGRPYLEGRPLDFNLSHSCGWVAVALTAHGRVGLDIEMMKPERPADRIASRFFSAEEAQAVREKGAEWFYRLWTAKEAALKMTGEGLAGGLAAVRPLLYEGGSGCVVRLGQCRGWGLRWFDAAENVAGAVAVDACEPLPLEFFELADAPSCALQAEQDVAASGRR